MSEGIEDDVYQCTQGVVLVRLFYQATRQGPRFPCEGHVLLEVAHNGGYRVPYVAGNLLNLNHSVLAIKSLGRQESSQGAAYNISEVVNDEVDLGVALNNTTQKTVHSSNYLSDNIRDFVEEVDEQRVQVQGRKRSVHDGNHCDGTSQPIFPG